ncbi:NgoPII family restriction endonuclease [Waterburya agarophytonicola K14]|uniref:NgoPII family restriction endonuclease n=1 Tax=Waterburya agarophytonicola KI4 TaxID=2874699 RepID=A0A964BNU7_9CYAN|nr:NgoPII family restriction endonuclease [Waterburya agarophytonicola]MCC0176076.1 NgoPII family restriction endonuclease [Waterburya agarophytonicola KI4]
MTDILKAISNIITNPVPDILNHYQAISNNRINAVGDALEEYIKDAFADTINEDDLRIRADKHSQTFSWLGNQNNPPDMILKNGDAIEVKKITSLKSQIALNSSYPKNKLLSSDPMLVSDCRNCEDWKEKDIIYIIGVFKKHKLNLLWMIYGNCYAANSDYYTRIKNKIKDGIKEIQEVEFSETKELGRVNKVDPLGITYLRIRGMWGIDNPMNVYDYLNLDLDRKKNDSCFQLTSIIPEDKYLSLISQNSNTLQSIKSGNLQVSKSSIKSPNNPAQMTDVRIISHVK